MASSVATREEWHHSVGSIIRDITGQRCKVVERTQGPYQPTLRSFELASNSTETYVEWIDRDRGGRTPVVTLIPSDDIALPTVWMSWYERWNEPSLGVIDLAEMSATFYWGLGGRRRIQLLRAEWASVERAPVTSAQPHWQIDTGITGLVGRPGAATDGGLVELPTGDERDNYGSVAVISISSLHLGMAGWRNAADYPACWRHDLESDPLARKEWLRRTLRQAADQFQLLEVAV